MSGPSDSVDSDDSAVAALEISTVTQLHSDRARPAGGDAPADDQRRAIPRTEATALLAGDLAPPGALLGPYRIVRRLGRGGMGVVYEAEDPQLSSRSGEGRMPSASHAKASPW